MVGTISRTPPGAAGDNGPGQGPGGGVDQCGLPVLSWCDVSDVTHNPSLCGFHPNWYLRIFPYHGELFFQGVHCFLFSSHSFEFYFLLSFLFSCFKVGLGATQILVAFRVHYPPHPLPVSLSLAKFKFIIFGQGPNSGFFNSVFHSHPQRLIV